jgi:cytochrome c oxidase subunit I
MGAISNMLEKRTCDTTGLPVCLNAQFFIRLNAVCAVVFLLIGGIAALLLALTRWQTVHLLGPEWFYRILTVHGINMLIFWILFIEMSILYFASTTLLNSRLFSKQLAWVSWGLMIAGAVSTNYIIFVGKADVLMTSYLPLLAHPIFYLGIILFAVGALLGVFNFFGTVYIARRDKTYEGSMPLVTFGALAAAIIAVVAIGHGAIALVPTLTFSLGLTPEPDPMWYRLIWWGLGHQSQQVNVCAMVAVWYFLATVTTGAKPPNEAVCRAAFVLYILFINIASAHHLLVDPGVGAAWKIWNTSYAMYLAVLASMIHGFTVPASVELGMRAKGYTKGLFNWLTNAPWGNPGFSGFFLSLLIFGFIGGITGVTLGTQQINIIAHNTLRIPGHFHATVVGGTTLAFMGLTYYVIPLMFQKNYIGRSWARIQPYIFATGIVMMSLGMSFAGSEGVARRTWDIEAAGIYGASTHVMLGLLGIGGVLAFLGLLIFALLAVGTLLFGKSIKGKPMTCWGVPRTIADVSEGAPETAHAATEHGHPSTPGTMTIVIVFLLAFAVYYFANWLALADVWHVR